MTTNAATGRPGLLKPMLTAHLFPKVDGLLLDCARSHPKTGRSKPSHPSGRYYPVVHCFMRALPFTYRNVSAVPGTTIRIRVSGDCGGEWYLYRQEKAWLLTESERGQHAAGITIPQEIAWRIFTKGIDRASASSQATITGDSVLALPVLGMVSIVSG